MAKATIYERAAAQKKYGEEDEEKNNKRVEKEKEIMSDDGQIVSKME